VSAGENADQREANHVVLAANHAAQRFFEFGGFMGNGDCGLGRHYFDSTIGRGADGVTYVTRAVVGFQPQAIR